MNIISKKRLYYLISLVIIIPGLISLVLYGLRPSIDFTGGSRMRLAFPKQVDEKTTTILKQTFASDNIQIATLQPSDKQVIIRTTPITEKENTKLLSDLQKKIPSFKQEEFETIGPTVGNETTLNAIKAVVVASILIVLYIAWSFRKVPKPTSSWKFGVTAIVALLHDVLVLVGIFSLLGHFFHVEVDSLFITALLTVMGFSVHDTIVVFDRIRENLLRGTNPSFSQTVNDSMLQTLGRSLNTSLTAMLVLFTLLIFGGETIRWFVIALLVGIASGTYSSIFNAAPLLVSWDEFERKRRAQGK